MISLTSLPPLERTCPRCGGPLRTAGWYAPGMRTLAELDCPACGRRYYGDLPSGFGLMYPMLLDAETGEVEDVYGASWFARWLAESYRERSAEPLPLEVETVRELRRPLLLDCLDGLYGHALLKLLNAQYHLDRDERDLLVLVPRNLRWLVPEGVAEIWTLDVPLDEARRWSDWLAARLRERLAHAADACLSLAFTHPDPAGYAIERFTGVAPHPVGTYGREGERPVVTYVWRDDRRWAGKRRDSQERRVEALAEALRAQLDGVDVAVAGVAQPGGLSGAIADLRDPAPGSDRERDWCRRYAASDVVIGVHGSNMLLPSAHAAAAVELLPDDRLGNAGQSLLPRVDDPRDALLRYRLLPLDSSPQAVARVIAATIRELPSAEANFLAPVRDRERLRRDPLLLARARRTLRDRT